MAHFEAEIPRFLNMYDKGGSIFPDLVFFSSKNALKKGLFGRTPIWGNLTLGVLEDKPVTSGQLLRLPLKTFGYNSSH